MTGNRKKLPAHIEALREPGMRRADKGFSLLELLVVVVVAAIIAAIAVPTYQHHTRKSRRAAATAALIDATSRQEQFFLDNKSYTTTITAGGLNMQAVTEGGDYSLSVDAPTGACILDRCYRVRATPQGVQAADSCGVLMIDSERVKTPPNCW
jgi:type IV pilus assembly protein PilE